MDVILGLMATGAGGLPFTPLREASEQLFRHSCHLLMPAGKNLFGLSGRCWPAVLLMQALQ